MPAKIALIHATVNSLAPFREAFEDLWPEPERTTILEDSLSRDRAGTPELSPALTARINVLADYAMSLDVDGILFSCSAFGPAIEQAAARLPVPVLKPNEAMLEEALEVGGRIGLLATFEATIADVSEQFDRLAESQGKAIEISPVLATGAMQALNDGDPATHDRRCAEAAADLSDCDVVLLAQASMARAQAAVAETTGGVVLTSPASAVSKMRRLVG